METLISVIVPCYNTEKFIERCLDSILNQTYQNLEVLVIDDGSVDSSAEIIKRVSTKDSRVKYIYQQNSGVSAARNKGLECATGEWITFVDSDDTIAPEMYRVLAELMIQYKADISHCSYVRCESGELKYIGNSNQIHTFSGDEVAGSLLEANLFTPSCWNKLFRKSVIGNIRFDTRFKINEDLLFDFFVFQNADKAVFIDSCLYTYHVEDTSSCNNTSDNKKMMDCYAVAEIINRHSKGKPYEIIAARRFCDQDLPLYWVYINTKNNKNNARQLRKRIIAELNNGEFSSSARKKAVLVKYFPILYKPIVRIYDRIRKPNWDL